MNDYITTYSKICQSICLIYSVYFANTLFYLKMASAGSGRCQLVFSISRVSFILPHSPEKAWLPDLLRSDCR